MGELEKMVRVIKKLDAAAPHAVLLVLDATVGQNALRRSRCSAKSRGVTGLVMTKLDGTARGGILASIAEKFKLPIHSSALAKAWTISRHSRPLRTSARRSPALE